MRVDPIHIDADKVIMFELKGRDMVDGKVAIRVDDLRHESRLLGVPHGEDDVKDNWDMKPTDPVKMVLARGHAHRQHAGPRIDMHIIQTT